MPDRHSAPRVDELVPRFPGITTPREVDHSGQQMFRGQVRSRTVSEARASNGLTVMATTFEPGAATVWHTHDSDQALVVIRGRGAIEDDRGVRQLCAGDAVVVPGGHRHRHLAAPDAAMTHLSITTLGGHHLGPGPTDGPG